MGYGIICNGGLSAMLQAQLNGTPFTFSSAQISSDVWNITGDESSLPDVVYSIPSSQLVQVALSSTSVRTVIYLGLDVGTFTIGTVGLFYGSTLFALAGFPSAGSKVSSSPPQVVGNIRTFYIDLDFVGSASALSLSVESTDLQAAIQALLAGQTGVVTARQFRTALNAAGMLAAALAAITALPLGNQASIDWSTCAPVNVGSPVLLALAVPLDLTDGGISLIAAAAGLPA